MRLIVNLKSIYLASNPRTIPMRRMNTGMISSLPIHMTKIKCHFTLMGLAAVIYQRMTLLVFIHPEVLLAAHQSS